jgi:hypothetical protein
MPSIIGTHPDAPVVHEVGSSGTLSTPAGSTANIGSPSTPVRRRVRLHDQPTGRLLRETWSAAGTGVFQFHHLRAGTFYVAAFDHTGQYGSVIESGVVLPSPGA